MKEFNVIIERNGAFISYDVMPYFIEEYKRRKKPDRPVTFDEFKEFVINEGKYMYWSRCEYEIILSDWPSQKVEKKIDVMDQIMMNLDIVIEILMENINGKKRQRNKTK